MRPEELEEPAPLPAEESPDAPVRSLLSDVEALIDDARTFVDAELNFQKSRIGFVANRVKLTIGLALGAVFFGGMALFGLTVGLIIALTPLITAWGATAVVVGGLLLCMIAMILKSRSIWAGMMDEIHEDDHG